MRPIIVEVRLTEDPRHISGSIDMAEASKNRALIAKILVDTDVVAVRFLSIEQRLGIVSGRTVGVRSQRSI